MTSMVPEKIHIVPDEWHIDCAGRLPDGRYLFSSSQLSWQDGQTTDFMCTFFFDEDGTLVDHCIDCIGIRGQYSKQDWAEIENRHERFQLGLEITDFWLRPFQVMEHGEVFGFIVQGPEDFFDSDDEDYDEDYWRVEFMPGNTLSFYPPWEDGLYDT